MKVKLDEPFNYCIFRGKKRKRRRKPRRKPLHKMPHDKINWYENKHRRQKRDSEFEKPRDGYIPSLW